MTRLLSVLVLTLCVFSVASAQQSKVVVDTLRLPGDVPYRITKKLATPAGPRMHVRVKGVTYEVATLRIKHEDVTQVLGADMLIPIQEPNRR